MESSFPFKTSPRYRDRSWQHKLPKDVYSCHVSPLPINIKSDEFRKLFNKYDDFCGIYISRLKKLHNDRYTFGFAYFKNKESADHAVQYITKNIDGSPLVVSHSKKRIASPDHSNSNSTLFDLDKYFVSAFKETWKAFDDPNKAGLDSIFDSISHKRFDNFEHQAPASALSVDVTESTTKNLDYKLWRTFFREQNDISKTLREMSRDQTSGDIRNLNKYDSKKPESFSKEKKPEKEENERLGRFCAADQENPGITVSNHKTKDSQQGRSYHREFFSSNNDEESGYSHKDQRLEYFEGKNFGKNENTIARKNCQKNVFANRYPKGRGIGLSLLY